MVPDAERFPRFSPRTKSSRGVAKEFTGSFLPRRGMVAARRRLGEYHYCLGVSSFCLLEVPHTPPHPPGVWAEKFFFFDRR